MATASCNGTEFAFEGELLHEACLNDKSDTHKQLLENGFQCAIDSCDMHGRTPLHLAALHGRINCVRILLERGVDPNVISGPEDKGCTALHHAATNGHLDCVEAMLGCRADVHLLNLEGETPIEVARKAGTPESAKCVAYMNKVVKQRRKDADDAKREKLYVAIRNRDYQEVELLMKDMHDPFGVISRIGDFRHIVDVLLPGSVDVLPNRDSGVTPLYAACYGGHLEFAKILLAHFPEHLNSPLQGDGTYPVHAACLGGHADVVRLLCGLRRRSSASGRALVPVDDTFSELVDAEPQKFFVDINARDKEGYTPLHFATMRGYANVVQELLSCIPAKSELHGAVGCLLLDALADGRSALHYAVLNDYSEIVRLLLKNGADHSKSFHVDGHVVSSVYYAALTNKEAVLKVLLGSGAVDEGNKALLLAIATGRENILQVLLNEAVIPDAAGSTVLSPAANRIQLAGVIFNWHKKQLPRIEENWLLEAIISKNLHAATYLRNNKDVCVSLVTDINLSDNRLESLPSVTFQLPFLKRLNLAKNKITSLPVREEGQSAGDWISSSSHVWHCPFLETLELQGNALTSLPVEVFTLPALEMLDASRNKIARLPFEMWTCRCLRELRLEGNAELMSLPHSRVANMSDQVEHKLRNEEEEDEGEEEEDECEGTRKSNLDLLDLSNTTVRSVPTCLPCLAPNLRKLYMNCSNVLQTPSISLLPENLAVLELSRNNLEIFDLSATFGAADFTCYGLCRSSVTPRTRFCQHRGHTTLRHLVKLDLSGNKLRQVVLTRGSPTVGLLNSLVPLFPELRHLDLSKNGRLIVLPKEIGSLTGLVYLDVSSTGLEALPPELSFCSKLDDLKVDLVPLKSPPLNIMEKRLADGRRDVAAITSFLRSLQNKFMTYGKLQLMFVGQHGLGKTTLLEKLRRRGRGSYRNPHYKDHFTERWDNSATRGNIRRTKKLSVPSTIGVNLCDWSYKKLTFTTWDFAGQTEPYATHQCFFSKRALYLLVWRLTDGIDGVIKLGPWLMNIQAHARDANVIIVGTFLDQLHWRTRARDVAILRGEIERRYKSLGGGFLSPPQRGLPKIIAIKEVICTTGYNIGKLRNLIYDVAWRIRDEDQQSIGRVNIPASYVEVEKAVRNLLSDMCVAGCAPVLEEKDFRRRVLEKVPLRNGVAELNQAVQFLHDCGVLLHYDDPSLHDLYFLDPQWLCDFLAHVHRATNPLNGVIKLSSLRRILQDQRQLPAFLCDKFVDLLLGKFEFAINLNNTYLLIPSRFIDKQDVSHCPTVSEQEPPELRNATSIHAYLHRRVFRRQYLMTYVPSGFWTRLFARLNSDNRIGRIVDACCQIQGLGSPKQSKADIAKLMRIAPRTFSCWKSGIELLWFGFKLLRVCQLARREPFYGANKPDRKVFVVSPAPDTIPRLAVEIVAPCVTLIIDKSRQPHTAAGTIGPVVGVLDTSASCACQLLAVAAEHIDSLLGEWYMDASHCVKTVRRVGLCPECVMETVRCNKEDAKLSGKLVDDTNLLPASADPICSRTDHAEIEREIAEALSDVLDNAPDHDCAPGIQGEAPGPLQLPGTPWSLESDHLSSEILISDKWEILGTSRIDSALSRAWPSRKDTVEQKNDRFRLLAKGCIIAFEFEDGCKLLRQNESLSCPFHGVLDLDTVFPDISFQDLYTKYVIQDACDVRREQFIGSGAYGDVFRVSVRRPDNTWDLAAIKVPKNTDESGLTNSVAVANAHRHLRSFNAQPTIFSYESYKLVRQELAVLVRVKHENIVDFLGVQVNPLGILLEYAPAGSLDKHYAIYRQRRQRLDSYVIQEALKQISSALKYLHYQYIIYRDLKCENILVWDFPDPDVGAPENRRVRVKIADYGISRSVALTGAKGRAGTPGFMAPEMLLYGGKERYTNKVDCFSFGSLMYELMAMRQPFQNKCLNNRDLPNQYMMEGRRPELSDRGIKFPLYMRSLMDRCWSHYPDDRPSASEIHSLSSRQEFPRLYDAFDVGKSFTLKCSTAPGPSSTSTGAMIIDGRSVVGSSLWLCGQDVDPANEHFCFMKVFSYEHRDFTLVKNWPICVSDRIVHACAIGSTVWFAMESGVISVFCTSQQMPVAFTYQHENHTILQIVHSPICNTVLVSVDDGTVFAYDDDLNTYPDCPDSGNDFLDLPSDRQIRELRCSRRFACGSPVHCMAVVPSISTVPCCNNSADFVATPSLADVVKPSDSFELWCGQEHGLIAILDVRSFEKALREPVTHGRRGGPVLADLMVNFLETAHTYPAMTQNGRRQLDGGLSSSVWTALYTGTVVYRWNIHSRSIAATLDIRRCAPHNDLNSGAASKFDLSEWNCQITALLVVERSMYVGSSYGCFIVCDAIDLRPLMSVRCYQESVDFILPLTIVSTRAGTDHPDARLVVSCGRRCLDQWSRKVDRNATTSTTESTMLMWLADPFY